jgi:hypothetical protein
MVWPPIVKFGSGSLRGQLNGAGKPEVNGPLSEAQRLDQRVVDFRSIGLMLQGLKRINPAD